MRKGIKENVEPGATRKFKKKCPRDLIAAQK